MRIIGGILKAIISVLMIGAVIVAGVFIYQRVEPALSSATNAKPKSTAPVVFVIRAGELVGQIADHLQQAGIIDNTIAFRIRLRLLDAEGHIQAGTYSLTPGMDMDTLIKTIGTSQEVAVGKITVIEGLRLEEIAESLGTSGVVSPTAFLAKTTILEGMAVYSDTFIANSGKPSDKSLEGFLFPDTYEIARSGNDDSDTVIKTMLSTMEQRFTPEMLAVVPQRQIEGQPATVYQILTLASIVQREGVVPDELPVISSVYWNRIKDGTVLNADPTSQYANGKPGKWWPGGMTLAMLHINSPYNTYDNRGLPPGPICNPGLAAIKAAIYPADTQYYYFVAKNDGSGTHAFAKTAAEHERNLRLYGYK